MFNRLLLKVQLPFWTIVHDPEQPELFGVLAWLRLFLINIAQRYNMRGPFSKIYPNGVKLHCDTVRIIAIFIWIGGIAIAKLNIETFHPIIGIISIFSAITIFIVINFEKNEIINYLRRRSINFNRSRK